MQDTYLESDVVNGLWENAQGLRDPMVTFARKLIQTPSLPGQEDEVAQLVVEEMQRLEYDEVWVDQTGNVVGLIHATLIQGERPRRSVMFNTHMDQVDVGDPSRWPYLPFEATVVDGHIWGRGSSDLKGALACQVYAGALIKAAGAALPNNVYVSCVVQEEIGGHGAAMLAAELQTDFVVIGEPSANRLALGHRGRIEIHVTITGKSVHASVPQTGVNPLFSMSRFLLALQELPFEPDPNAPRLGPTTIAPTLFTTDQSSANVTPGECKVVLDIRNTARETPDSILEQVLPLLTASLDDGASGRASIPPLTMTSYTGLSRTYGSPENPWGHVPFSVPPDGKLEMQAHTIISQALKRDVPKQLWRFATDAGYFVARGMQVIGFGPGYEEVIHTVNERISIDMMVEGMVANAALAIGLD